MKTRIVKKRLSVKEIRKKLFNEMLEVIVEPRIGVRPAKLQNSALQKGLPLVSWQSFAVL
jgi:hypothetical protein